MKLSLFFSSLLCLSLFFGCSKDDTDDLLSFESTGVLSGLDEALCACCGGYILSIDGDDTAYRVEALPADSGISLDETSKAIKFNWSLDRECNSINYITIEAIELN